MKDTTKSIIYGASPIALYIIQTSSTEYVQKFQQALTLREFDSCLHFFTNQIAQNVDYINAFEFFCCQICEIICSIM